MTVRQVNRQFGSKARIAPRIVRMLPAGKRIWVEVFAGTAAVTLAKPPHREEHLNDLNRDIWNLFRVLRSPGARVLLLEAVSLTPWSQEEFRRAMAEPRTGDPVEDARRYLVRSWQGMAGSRRHNTGWIAVDGATKARPTLWCHLPERIEAVARRLKQVALHCKPAAEMVRRFAGYEEAILYLDPPYPRDVVNSRAAYEHDMDEGEHMELLALARAGRAAVIITMAANTLYDDELRDWHHTLVDIRGLRNAVKPEVIFTNYDPGSTRLL